jgi:hypothetical protein
MKNLSDVLIVFGVIFAAISGFFVYVGHVAEPCKVGLVYGVSVLCALMAIGLFISAAADQICKKLSDKKIE